MSRHTFPASRTLWLFVLLALAVIGAQAATLTVGPGAYATIQAAINAASPGDIIDIPVGNYPENLTLTKPLTLRGPNAGIVPNTPGNPEVMNVARGSEAVIAPASGRAISVTGAADNVTIDGLAFTGADRGIWIAYPTDGVISNLIIVNNYFFNMKGLGIQCITSAQRDNWNIANNRFDGWSDVSSTAIWLAGSTNVNTQVADNFIRGSAGVAGSMGILVDNSAGATVRGNYITQLTSLAIQMTDWQGSVQYATIADNVMWNVGGGVQVADAANLPGGYIQNITVENNTITNVARYAFRITKLTGEPYIYDSVISNIVFRGNTVNQDVALLTESGALVNIALSHNILQHGDVMVADNTIALTGEFTGGATAAYAIAARGNIATLSITGNTLSSNTPAGTAGILLASNDADWGVLPATASISVANNSISGFENGLCAYDFVAATYGNLPDGIDVQVHNNTIAGNAGYGVRNDGVSAVIDAMNNNWGDPSGPSGGVTDPISGAVANGTGDRVSTNVHFSDGSVSITVKLLSSQGNGIAGGVVSYYTDSWQPFGTTDATGAATLNLPRGTYSFRMVYNGGTSVQGQYVAGNTDVIFRMIPVMLELRNSTGVLTDPGTAEYFAGAAGWQTIGVTSGGKVSTELLPTSYLFAMTYASMRMQQQQNVGANALVTFQLPPVTIKLLDSLGNGIAGGVVSYYQKKWFTLGTTDANGTVTADLAPGSYTFRVEYAGGSASQAKTIRGFETITFTTKRVTVELRNNSGTLMDGGAVQFYAGSVLGWQNLGNTVGGQVSKELLAGSYTFAMTYAYQRVQKAQSIGTNPVVTFQTGKVHSTSNTCNAYYIGAWRTFTQDMQLLPGSYTFRFSTGSPAQKAYTIAGGIVNTIR